MKKQKVFIEVPNERIVRKIFLIRGRKVMVDRDLADLYQVSTKSLNQAVKRNINRFPDDFMFRLNKEEIYDMRSQFVTALDDRTEGSRNDLKRNVHHAPYVFTEQGVAMLSSVLNSARAIQVNIQVIRTFTRLRELLVTNKQLREKIESMEKKYDKKLAEVFEVIKRLLIREDNPIKEIGFRR